MHFIKGLLSRYWHRFLFISILLFQCKEDEEKILPLGATLTINNVTASTAQVVAIISDEGSTHVATRGICVDTRIASLIFNL